MSGSFRPHCRRRQDSGGVRLSLSATGCISCCCSALNRSTAARSRRYWPPIRMRRAGRRPALIHRSTVLPLTPSSTPASPDDSKSARAVDLRAGRVMSTRPVYVLTVPFAPAAPAGQHGLVSQTRHKLSTPCVWVTLCQATRPLGVITRAANERVDRGYFHSPAWRT
jgi:hypothetical protein